MLIGGCHCRGGSVRNTSPVNCVFLALPLFLMWHLGSHLRELTAAALGKDVVGKDLWPLPCLALGLHPFRVEGKHQYLPGQEV